MNEPWFTLTKLELKKCEARLNRRDYSDIRVGDFIFFSNEQTGFRRTFLVKVEQVISYSSFEEYLTSEGIGNCFPGVDDITEAIAVCRKDYTSDDESRYGIRCLKLTLDCGIYNNIAREQKNFSRSS